MTDLGELPSFLAPPVDEVSVGIQFSNPGFLPTLYGAFHARIRDEFPSVEVRPPLPPSREVFPPLIVGSLPAAMPTVPQIIGMLGNSRVLYVSEDGCSLVQLQSDRLHFNWRRKEHAAYPRFGYMRDRFAEAFQSLTALFQDNGLGSVNVTQCEVFYGNPLPSDVTGVSAGEPEKVLRPWTSTFGPELTEKLEDLSFNVRFNMNNPEGEPFGRLTVTMLTNVSQDNIPALRLELIARGSSKSSELSSIFDFFDAGHSAIVRAFAAVTTPDMHLRWGRQNG
jgi:uncharacterized protein (TIGR04255 family)